MDLLNFISFGSVPFISELHMMLRVFLLVHLKLLNESLTSLLSILFLYYMLCAFDCANGSYNGVAN